MIALPLPSDPGAKTVIVALEHHDRLEVSAIRLDPFDRADLLPAATGSPTKVVAWALLYPETLEELELEEGKLEATADPTRARPLPAEASATYRAEAVEGAEVRWIESELSPELTAFRFPALEVVCPQYDLLILPTHSGVTFGATRLDETGALLTSSSGSMWRVSARGLEPFRPAPGPVVGAWRAPDGEIWAGGSNGRLFRGHPETGLVEVASSPADGHIRWLAGPHDASAPFELFTVSHSGSFARFDGRDWEPFVISTSTSSPRGGVVWLGPDEAVALPPQPTNYDVLYHHRRPGQPPGVAEKKVILAAQGDINAITLLPGFGLTFLTKLSVILVEQGQTFTRLEEAPVAGETSAIAPYRRGFVYAAKGISFIEYHPIAGYCPKVDVMVPIIPKTIVPLEEGFVIAGDPEGGEEEGAVVVAVPR